MRGATNIGVVCDHARYTFCLEKEFGYDCTYLPFDAQVLPIRQQGSDKVEWEGSKLDAVVIYVHFSAGFRQANHGLVWLKDFRARTFRVPVVLLTWRERRDLWLRDPVNGCFASPYFRDSCASVKLPVRKNDVEKALLRLRPVSLGELEEGLVFALAPWLSHCISRLVTSADMDQIQQRLCGVLTKYPNSFVEKALTPLLRSSTVDEFRAKASTLLTSRKR
jgi:hypothetical protein